MHRDVFGSPEFHRNQLRVFFFTRVEELHAASLLKCFSHAQNHAAVSVCHPNWPPCCLQVPATTSRLGPPPLMPSARWLGCEKNLVLVSWPGQTDLKVGIPRINNGTCACDTAPPAGPGTVVSRSAAGKGARAGQWHWLGLGGPELACGPESPSEPGRSRRRGIKIQVLASPSGCSAVSRGCFFYASGVEKRKLLSIAMTVCHSLA